MEAARRRLAVICSHLRLTGAADSRAGRFPGVSDSICSPSSANEENANPEDFCVFCRIIRGESPACKIYEDEKCLCILDINPLSLGHALIIPKIHSCSLDTTPPSVIAAVCSKIPIISKAIMRATGYDSFNLLVNNGAAAGQVIFHTHIHIIPRKARDCLWASESLKRLPLKLDEEASQLAESIRKHLPFQSTEKDDQRQD